MGLRRIREIRDQEEPVDGPTGGVTDDDVRAAFPAYVPAPVQPPAPPHGQRAIGWQPADRLRCPRGHSITRRDTWLDGSLLIRCGASVDSGECRAYMLAVCATSLLDPERPDNRLLFTIEITRQEARYLGAARPPLLYFLELVGQAFHPSPIPCDEHRQPVTR